MSEAPLSPAELRRRFFRHFPAAGTAIFLAALDQTIVATALPAIAAELGEVERLSWVVVAYLLATTLAAPVYGKLGDAFGRRRMMLVALAVTATGSVLCALAPSLTLLAVARLVQGCGGGGLIALAQALIGEAIPPRERIRFQAWFGSTYVVANSLGPLVGGVLTQQLGWRSVFLVNLPVAAAAAVLTLRLPTHAAEGEETGGRGRSRTFRADWAGFALFVAFVVPTMLAMDRAQKLSVEALPFGLACAALAVAALVLLIRQERRAADPLLPLNLLAIPMIWRCDTIAACVGAALVGLITFVPIYLEVVRGIGPAQIGLAMLPLAAGGSVGALVIGRLVARSGRTMVFPAIGMGVAAALLAVVAFAIGSIGTAALPWVLGLVAFGLGTSFPVVQTVVQVAAGRERLGQAAASLQFARALGSAAGAALMGVALFATLAASDPEAAALFARRVSGGPAALAAMTEAQRAALGEALAGGFRAAFLVAAAVASLGAWLAARAPDRRL